MVLIILGKIVSKIIGKKLKNRRRRTRILPKFTKPPVFQSRKIRQNHHRWSRFFREEKAAFAVFALFLFSIFGYSFLEKYSHWFRTSLIESRPNTFTGTVFPIEKVPNWVALSESERKMNFDQLPKSKIIDLPEYNISTFKSGQKINAGEKARNAYISFPVPNLGNYQLDGSESSGSHPGVDIKTPVGTPVRAVGNGWVEKVKNTPTGFGKHLVISHPNFPSPENFDQKTTLYSSYAHLSEFRVKVGDRVEKGQIIALTGQTGMTTAPHLHFQIDRADAPFTPYWPFTWSEIRTAGISSYFDAVKYGLGQKKAEKYTIHPMNFAAAHLNFVAPNLVASEDIQTSIPTETFVSAAPKVDEKPAEIIPEKVEKSINFDDTDVEFLHDRIFVPGEKKVVKIRINPKLLISSPSIQISSTLKSGIEINPEKITLEHIDSAGRGEIEIRANSDRPFKLVAKASFGTRKSASFRARVFADVPPNHASAAAIKYLKQNEIISGYPDGSFRPEGTINRAESIKMLLKGNRIPVATAAPSKFSDVPKGAWFSDLVNTAAQKNLIRGYSDQQFRPENTITRAEFLKVATLAAGIEVSDFVKSDPFRDVSRSDWSAPYFEVAKNLDLLELKKGGFVAPNTPISRSEAAEIIFGLSQKNLVAAD